MSGKDFWFFGGVFFLIFLFGGFLTFQIFGNQTFSESVSIGTHKVFVEEESEPVVDNNLLTQCSETDKLNLEGATVLEIQKLSYYQEICDSLVTDKLMYFSVVPSDQTLDQILNKDTKIFLEFKKYGIKPIVVFEPYTSDRLMFWSEISEGKYDKSLDLYLEGLVLAGLNANDFALIIPLPEPNVPNWGIENNNPEEFGKAYNKIANKFKTKFEQIPMGILFNSQTYEADDTNWENGIYDYYDSYLTGIEPRRVDVLVMQGFPWVSGASKRKIEITDPNIFLGVDLIPGTLHSLKIKKVWFNTGTFSTKYANDPVNKVVVSNSDRKKILNEIAEVSNTLANQGYDVSVNLFAQNKSDTPEGTDWSYSTDDQKILIRDFVRDLNLKQIGFSLFDM